MKEGGPGIEELELRHPKPAAWLPKSHWLAIFVGMLAISGFAFYMVRQSHQAALDHWQTELSASVRFQTWIVRNSLQQSKDDAQMLADFAPSKKCLLHAGAAIAGTRPTVEEQQVASRFDEYRKIYEYDALYLLDAEGRIAVLRTDSAPADVVLRTPKFSEAFASVARNRRFAVELAPGFGKKLSLIFMMPVFAGDQGGNEPRASDSLLGAVVIVDPFDRDLLPLLAAQTVVSRTGETVLLQLDNSGARYTSPLRYRPGRGGRAPVPDTLRQAASSAMETKALFGQFVDYRGVSVLASMEKIEGIRSVLVSKVDESEAFAEFRRIVRTDSVTGLSVFLAYFGLILIQYRTGLARQMREGLQRQQFVNQVLETIVAERTSQLAQTNQLLHQELGERQKAEAEIRQLNADLDQRVHERTVELEVANKELEAFSYSVSHDLRAPLRRMRGFSTVLLEEHAPQLPGEAQELLQVVNKNAIQMGELIDCLLAFSQLGRRPLRKQEVLPAEIVMQAWQELSGEREGREIEMTLSELTPCQADPLLLKQVFVNLLSNALKYSRTRKVSQIQVGCRDSAIYFVRDNGVGFDMRYRDKLFGVFKRLHRAGDYEGIGIGLAIVERIVRRHGGEVWAEAVVNQGATFYFTLAESSSAPNGLASSEKLSYGNIS